MKRRVVVTGMGIVSPVGNTVEEAWSNIKQNKCGIDFITRFDTDSYRVKLAAEVKNLDMEQYISKRELKFNDRFTQFARIAAMQAMQDVKIAEAKQEQFGVILGSGIGGVETIAVCEDTLQEKGASRVSPYFIPMSLINLAAGQVAIDHHAKGHCASVVTACAAGTSAIGEAFHKIRDGYLDMVLAGGSEASITPLAVAGFQSMRALCESDDPARASIPFDAKRSGFVMGEGAGILVLEELEHAKTRGATIYAEVVGYGSTCDAHHITAPVEDGSGGAAAMKQALADAGLTPDAISYINAHGTSTPLNDKTETKAVKLAFGAHAAKLSMSSTKSHTGHLLGASGAVEAIFCIKALEDQFAPATIHHETFDPECDLEIIANTGKPLAMNYVMSNSLGFGGHNASIILKRWEQYDL